MSEIILCVTEMADQFFFFVFVIKLSQFFFSDGDEGSEEDLEKNPPPDVTKSLLTLGILLSYLIHQALIFVRDVA